MSLQPKEVTATWRQASPSVLATKDCGWKERDSSEKGIRKARADKVPYKYRNYVGKTKASDKRMKGNDIFLGRGRKYSLKNRINRSWRKVVTGERKACPSGRGKATHAKLERNVNHGMMHGYFLYCVGQFKVILNFDVRDHFCRACGCP